MDNELLKNSLEIPSIVIEEDDPKTDYSHHKKSIKEIKESGKEARKKAKSDYSRKRDTWVTISGLILVFVLIAFYLLAVLFAGKNDYMTSFLYLLNSVVMLIIGYIFGTKNTR